MIRSYFIIFLFLLSLAAARAQQPLPTEEQVKLQLPNNPVWEVLNVYEILTGKRLIRDANLAGPNLSIQVNQPISKKEAISLLEAALLLNGYTLVAVDENTSKILGSAKSPSTEGVTLCTSEPELPRDERVVSYFMPLHYISAAEAVKIFTPYAALRAFGSIIPIANANALVITENTPFIRRLIALQKHIDVPGRNIVTEFVALKRADAERVAELVSELIAEDFKENTPNLATSKVAAADPQQKEPSALPTKPEIFLPTPKIRLKADVRTNRIVVVAAESRITYLRNLIQEMDVAVDLEEPLERHLQFVPAGDVLPILSNILAEGGKDKDGTQSSQNQLSNSTSFGASAGSGSSSKPDKLQAPNENTAPLSLIVGKSRIIADRNSNKIIVIGPPEARRKAQRVLDMMDERPKQIFLATVIGQLKLEDGLESGVDYLLQFDPFGVSGGAGPSALSVPYLSRTSRAGGVDVVPDTAAVVGTGVKAISQVAQKALPLASGLSLYGTLADSLDVYVRALQETNRFRVLSRPMVFTTNNKKAVILSGSQVPVPRNSLTTALGTTAINSQPVIGTTIDYKDVILKLEVIPLVNSKDEVTLTIAQQNDHLEKTIMIGGNQVPAVSTQELTTTVTARNREVIVLGGLITSNENNIKSGIPLLKDIPGLGYLFGVTKKELSRRELIIFIQPIVINNHSDLMEANALERSMTDFQGDLIKELKKPDDSKRKKKREKKRSIAEK
ncbi:MAG: hypothetical protein C5B47_05855 [Verrucomicrobia bacterium]|nr:MAG: hypothetical protein C5B47_05855 [Verrucomicrobiota bacterium]